VELSPRSARHQGVRGAHAGGGLAAEEPSTELAHGFYAATFWPPRAGLGLHAGRGRKQHGRWSHRGEDGRLIRQFPSSRVGGAVPCNNWQACWKG
jgi:hypothetical protein